MNALSFRAYSGLRHLPAVATLLAILFTIPSTAQTLTLGTTNITTTIDRWQNASNATFQVSIGDAGGASKFYWIQEEIPWLSVSPSSGTSTGESDTITISFVTTSLNPGTNTAEIAVVCTAATNSPQSIWIDVVVNDDGGTNRAVRLSPSCRGVPGHRISIPVELISQGNESAVAFSLSYDKAVFSSPAVTLGDSVTSGSLMTNYSQTSSGRIGISVANQMGVPFSLGVSTVAVVSFSTSVSALPKGYSFSLGSTPVIRQVSDTNAYAMSTLWPTGSVSLFGGYEAEVLPRSTGTLAAVVTLADWVQIGRFSAGLDSITYAAEFQRADCAPRTTSGDGLLSVIDWVQAGRYYNGDEPVVEAAGPSSNLTANLAQLSTFSVTSSQDAPGEIEPLGSVPARLLSITSPSLTKGCTNTVTVSFNAIGNENALAFNASYDPTQLAFVSAEPLAPGALIAVRTAETASGRVGITVALPPGSVLPAGQQSIARIKYYARPGFETGSTTLGFATTPVTKSVVSATAQNLSAAYAADIAVALNGQPDTEAPALTIGTPATSTVFVIDEPFTLSGSASDNWRVAAVGCSNLQTAGTLCSGLSNWVAITPLSLGTNHLQVTAVDPAGNLRSMSVTVVYVMTSQEAAADDDSDGVSNWHEFLAGTDRSNPNSVLKLIGSGSAQGPTPGVYRISWQSVPGKRYGVYRTASLPGSFTRIGEVVAESDKTSYDDPKLPGSTQCFYTVMVE